MKCHCASIFLLFLSLLQIQVDGQSTVNLHIAAFNVQIFGVNKIANQDVVTTLSQIVRRYDVILIQEIRDSSQTSIYNFLATVNSDASVEGITYALNISERLGRSNSKEQYAFLYRTDRVEVISAHQYNDSENDEFEREPYSVLLRSMDGGIPDFFLTAIHTQPGSNITFRELNALVNVYNVTTVIFDTTNGFIVGDFNAGCQYLSRRRYNNLDLLTDSRFTWLIGYDEDTTTGNSVCAYDRIVVAGDIAGYVVNGTPSVFRFDMEYNLSLEHVTAVSDHYPVQFQLEGVSIQGSTSTSMPNETDSGAIATTTISVLLVQTFAFIVICSIIF